MYQGVPSHDKYGSRAIAKKLLKVRENANNTSSSS